MHVRAAEFLVGRDLAGRGAQERGSRQKHLRLAAHENVVVGKARQIGAAGRRRAMHHRHLRNARRRHARLVGEAASAFDKHLGLEEQVGAAGFHQSHHRQLVLQRHLLRSQPFLHAHRRRRAAFESAVGGRDHAADARDITDADDAAAAEFVMHAQTGERRDFEPWRAGVEQQREAFARHDLPALGEEFALGLARLADLVFQRAEFVDQPQHLFAVGAKGFGIDVDLALDDRHGVPALDRDKVQRRARNARRLPRRWRWLLRPCAFNPPVKFEVASEIC